MRARPPPGIDIELVELDGQELAIITLPAQGPLPALEALSPAEREVMRAVAQGRSNAAIARARGTSARTVANQLASIYQKLGVSSRHELLAIIQTREG